MKRCLASICALVLFACVMGLGGCASTRAACSANAENSIEALDVAIIKSFVAAVNEQNVERYVSLFTAEIQAEMRDFIARNGGADEFFVEASRELLSIAAIDDSFVLENDWLFSDAFALFADFSCYCVAENVMFKTDSGRMHSGEKTNVYVIASENGVRRLYRVSAIDREMLEGGN